MKKQLLICSALALAGCSSAPDTADVEKFLEPNFASCQNIEIVDIKKTNGYEEDGYYKVEFTYNIELKDPSMLKALLKTYEQEKESKLTWLAAMAAYNKQEGPLHEEIGRLYKEYEAQGPRPNQFSNDGSDYPYGSRLQEYEMAVKQWKQLNPPPAIWQQKKDELEQLYADRSTLRQQQPHGKIYPHADTAVESLYLKGCPSGTYMKFMRGIFNAPRQAAQSHQDPTYWFKEYEIQMQGIVTMRKTDNGWRALNAG